MRNNKSHSRQAIVLLSGGLDSATTLYLAKKRGFKCSCLIFDYGQRHKREIESARRIAHSAKCESQVIKISLPWRGSSLLDRKIAIPKRANRQTGKWFDKLTTPGTIPSEVGGRANIPSTYVPGRNIIFLSFALSYAEAVSAEAIFIGAHTQDYSGYPDCRGEFYRAFRKVIATGTKSGVEKKGIKVETPLINRSKSEIIRLARKLGVPIWLTWSCYRGGRYPCGECESCVFRAKGFKENGLIDPLLAGKYHG